MLECPPPGEIAEGLVTDHCCTLSVEVLQRLGIANRIVTLEAHVRRFPPDVTTALYYGLADALAVLADRKVQVWSMRPGTTFHEREPVFVVEGPAHALATVRPAITGLLTFGSSIVTRANEIVRTAAGKPVYFFGLRKLHPAHVRQYLECAYVAGMEINATPQAAHVVPGLQLQDCQEHFVNLVADEPQQAWCEFVGLPQEAGAVFIVLDNYDDPVIELKAAVNGLSSKLRGVLLDTDSSRRGNIKNIIAELAWHLRLMNRPDVAICLTGGVTPQIIQETNQHVAAFGVGLSALIGPLFDFALQVVAVDGTPRSKVGVRPGKKSVFVCNKCARREIDLFNATPECCGLPMISLLIEPENQYTRDLRVIRQHILSR